jgi:hypothetical protein
MAKIKTPQIQKQVRVLNNNTTLLKILVLLNIMHLVIEIINTLKK